MKVKRGEIYLADLSDASGSEQGKVRPVVIIQNNRGNKYSPTTIVACLSSKINTKHHLPNKASFTNTSSITRRHWIKI